MKYAPVSGLSLALFKVLASSSMLFLSPFIFQLPPTKNFLPVMIAKSVTFTRGKNDERHKRNDLQTKRQRGNTVRWDLYNTVCNPAPQCLPLAQDYTPANVFL